MERVTRFDFASFSGRTKRTQQGFLQVPGNISRVGVLKYTRRDGSVFRELRHPDEVFHPDSLQSLQFAPVTDKHPKGLVTPSNVKALQEGIVASARQDSKFVAGELIVQGQRLITKIDNRESCELSAGYTCTVDPTPGTFNGERYDGIQRNIRYNHVAVGPRNWGRAGNDVQLHLDSLEDDIRADSAVEVRADDSPPDDKRGEVRDQKGKTTMDMTTVKIDGLDFEVPKTAAAALQKALTDRDGKIADLTKRTDGLQGKLDTLTTEHNGLKTKHDAATKPEAIQALVKARVDLVSSARKVLGEEAKLDDMSDRGIRIAVITKHDEEFKADDRSDDYIQARFDAVLQAAPERRDSVDDAKRNIAERRRPPSKRTDSRNDGDDNLSRIDSADAARSASLESVETAWMDAE